jgi:septal ring-binding cell division protein DamX
VRLRHRLSILGLPIGLVLLLLDASRPILSAQTEPRLVQGVRLAQEGLSDSARGVVERVVAATDPSDSLYPQALYARAMIAANAQDMRRDLQRIAVEYPSSSWADDALLRLAQIDYATGELESATRNLERLRLDYPSSPLFPQASFWAARAYFDLRKPGSACRWLAEGLPRVGSNVELRNQLGFYNQRCAGVALDTATLASRTDSAKSRGDSGAPPDTAARSHTDSAGAPVAPAGGAASPAPAGSKPAFRIQIAAVNTRAAADSIAKRVKSAGFDPLVSSEKGMFKIRVGRYPTRAEAQAALPRVRARLGGTPFIVAQS